MRKKTSLIIFILLIIFMAYISIFPFVFKVHYMKDYCDSLKEKKLNITELKLDINKNNFSFIEDKKENSILIYDADTIGKFTCNVDYNFNPPKITYMMD